ncbi:MAG: heme ABC transporter ATP-binding protein [Pseudomonadales bacterium]
MSLDAVNISLQVGDRDLLKQVDLKLIPGRIVVVVGPNGAGKTSLLRCLSGDVLPDKGQVLLNGQCISSINLLLRARAMGVLPQHSSLDFPFTCSEVVMLGRNPHQTGRQLDQEIVALALRAVDAQGLQNRYYTRLSGGEKQRVQLARVLAQVWLSSSEGERYLLLDEPTASFDLAHQLLTRNVIRQMANQGAGVFIVLHDLNLAAACADELIVMHQAKVFARGAPKDVLTVDLLKDVFEVDASITSHPVTGQPLIIV